MISKRGLLERARLYVIVDRDTVGEKRILSAAAGALAGGADVVQLRAKGGSSRGIIGIAKALGALAHRYRRPFIVNDDVALALACGADGVHLGRGDVAVRTARALMGSGAIIGVSAKSYDQAVSAKRAGADYFGVGPVFKTPVKRSLKPKGFRLAETLMMLGVPVFVIGGINHKNIRQAVARGFRRVAVIRAVVSAGDVRGAARRLKETLTIKL